MGENQAGGEGLGGSRTGREPDSGETTWLEALVLGSPNLGRLVVAQVRKVTDCPGQSNWTMVTGEMVLEEDMGRVAGHE